MKPILFSLFSQATLLSSISTQLNCDIGMIDIHSFPDKETYLKIISDVKNRKIIFIATLDKPDPKILPLIYAAETARDLGAKEIGLVAPYLAYMRQDKQFKPGEGITSKYFAKILSSNFDWMLTVDPHLHRHLSLNEIFTIPTYALHATQPIANWIQKNVEKPLIIGPDSESEQWVKNIADFLQVPYIVSDKTRRGDRDVQIILPNTEIYKNHTPVLVDDIISTGKTILETVKRLKLLNMKSPVCIGVHGLFVEGSYEELLSSGVASVVTSNSIEHVSNKIDISELISNCLFDICYIL